MGGEQVVSEVEGRLGIRCGETTPDAQVELRTVYCLGNCALSPAAMLDGRLLGRVNPVRIDRALMAARQ
jgi:formate dehydrogenase subunit gamma